MIQEPVPCLLRCEASSISSDAARSWLCDGLPEVAGKIDGYQSLLLYISSNAVGEDQFTSTMSLHEINKDIDIDMVAGKLRTAWPRDLGAQPK